MGFFEREKDAIIFRENGETVRIEAWNRDSLRVRACLVNDIEEGSVALLEKEEISGGWKVKGTFPLALFRGDSRILFGLQMVYYTENGERNCTFPPGEFTNELRLNLSYFTPDRLALLEL